MRQDHGRGTRLISLDDFIDVRHSLEFYRRYGDDYIDRFDGEYFRRVVTLDDGDHLLSMTAGTGLETAVSLSFWPPITTKQWDAVEHAPELFMSHDREAWTALLDDDPRLRSMAARLPGRRTMLITNVLHAVVRSVTAQQVSVTAAVAIRARLARRFGRMVRGPAEADYAFALCARNLAGAAVSELRECGLSERKALAVRDLAAAVERGELDRTRLRQMSDDEVTRTLSAYRGLGRWSADWFLARTLNRPVVVTTDLVVRKSVGALYRVGEVPVPSDVESLTAHWKQCAGTAQQTVLDHYQDRLTEGGR
jgi:DNA-3-methyladenine glycosylase II